MYVCDWRKTKDKVLFSSQHIKDVYYQLILFIENVLKNTIWKTGVFLAGIPLLLPFSVLQVPLRWERKELLIYMSTINQYRVASLVTQAVKNLPAIQETQFNSWVRKIPGRREWQPTPAFLSGEFHGQRILAGYSPWGLKEMDTTEQLTLKTSIELHICMYFYMQPFVFVLSYSGMWSEVGLWKHNYDQS